MTYTTCVAPFALAVAGAVLLAVAAAPARMRTAAKANEIRNWTVTTAPGWVLLPAFVYLCVLLPSCCLRAAACVLPACVLPACAHYIAAARIGPAAVPGARP